MRGLLYRRAALLAVLLLAALQLPVGVAAGAADKAYIAEVAPHSVPAGATELLTATLHNVSPSQQLGSANMTAPTGWTLLREDVQGTVAGANRGTARIIGDVLELRDLALAPNSVFTITFRVTAPCSAGTAAWAIAAKQANDFNGPPGNNFEIDGSSDLSATVTGRCALAFLDQPAHAQQDTPITSVPFDPTGAPIRVAFVDGEGNIRTSATGTVTIGIGRDASLTGATLAGKLMQDAASGVASFPGLSIDKAGLGYTLVASHGADSVTSTQFSIWETVTPCDANRSCTAEVTRRNSMNVSVSGTSSTDGNLLVSIGARTLACTDSARHAPEVVTVDSYQFEGAKTATLTIAKQVVQSQPSNDGAAHYDVCYQEDDSTAPFLLPGCGAPPCVAAKKKTGAGDVVITIRLPAWDPHFK